LNLSKLSFIGSGGEELLATMIIYFPMGNKMDEVTTEVLKAVERPRSVSELVSSLNRRNEAVVMAIADMEEMGLLERRAEKDSGRGRPRMLVWATDLGRQYLTARSHLEGIPLKATRAGFRRVVDEARYAARLRERGLDPFTLFMELNEYVRSARHAP
jgi:DNA-binding MarR family transcriptional regulator